MNLGQEVDRLDPGIAAIAGHLLQLLQPEFTVAVSEEEHDGADDGMPLGDNLGEVVVDALAEENVLVRRLQCPALLQQWQTAQPVTSSTHELVSIAAQPAAKADGSTLEQNGVEVVGILCQAVVADLDTALQQPVERLVVGPILQVDEYSPPSDHGEEEVPRRVGRIIGDDGFEIAVGFDEVQLVDEVDALLDPRVGAAAHGQTFGTGGSWWQQAEKGHQKRPCEADHGWVPCGV